MPHGKSPTHARKTRRKVRKKDGKNAAASSSSKQGSTQGQRVSESHPRRSKRDTAQAPSSTSPKPVRLQKLLASAGFGSRRDCEQFLVDERVTVNGRVAALGDRALPGVDEIRVDGEKLARERPSYWLLHKPRGVVTTVRDESGRPTVIDFLPSGVGRLYPVGRLDKETSGLLLLTNDGDTAHALLHPSLGNEREYSVSVKGLIDERAITRLESGIVLEEGRTAPGQVHRVRHDPEAKTSTFNLILAEGRKRQIRRSLLLLGFPVRRLVRIRMGPLRLGRLEVGEARSLRSAERRSLLEHVAGLRAGDLGGIGDRGAKRKTQRRPKSRSGSSRRKDRDQRTARSRKGTKR